jgi:DNA-binding CsgD family transcriptional regulator
VAGLTAGDYERVLEFLDGLYAAREQTALQRYVTEHVGELIACDTVTCAELDDPVAGAEVKSAAGYEVGVTLLVGPRAALGLALQRESREFGPRDYAVLAVLTPHLRRAFINAAMLAPRFAAPERTVTLTARERQVLTLASAGAKNHDIAAGLEISPRTVQKHLENAYAKLDVHSRNEAMATAAWAARAGALERRRQY